MLLAEHLDILDVAAVEVAAVDQVDSHSNYEILATYNESKNTIMHNENRTEPPLLPNTNHSHLFR